MKKVIAIVIASALMLALLPATAVMAVPAPSITATPLIAENVVGTSHTITADVDPNDVYEVEFEIVAGPNDTNTPVTVTSDANGVATWTYSSTESGVDVIQVSVPGTDASTEVFKLWLTDKFSGGGKIIQEDSELKKKDWNKITWGGWAGYCEGYPIGSFEVTFHNVSEDQLDKATFTTEYYEEFAALLDWLVYDTAPCPPADPPESYANFVWLNVEGSLVYRDGTVEHGWHLGIRATDNGEPGNVKDPEGDVASDSIVFALWDDEWSLEYESFLTGDFDADQDCFFSLRHELDGGNLQIVVPPIMVS